MRATSQRAKLYPLHVAAVAPIEPDTSTIKLTIVFFPLSPLGTLAVAEVTGVVPGNGNGTNVGYLAPFIP